MYVVKVCRLQTLIYLFTYYICYTPYIKVIGLNGVKYVMF